MKYENKYMQERYEAKQAIVKELNSLQDTYTFEIEEDTTNDGNDSIVLKGIVPIWVNYQEYTKTYHFGLHYYFETMPYVRYETEKKVRQEIGEPQHVHKLNGKKIVAWVEFLIKVWERLQEISKERLVKVEEFKQEIEKRGGKIGQTGVYGDIDGSIVKNGLEFVYHVHDEAYISKDIKVYYKVNDTLEEFDKLTANQWQEVSR